ncbi:MAG: RNA methyltransferase [Gomphosphaeria aponina SAG 52.96 = DSM 107014]|uniref:RNA methyltransferase n=1 Tax=Gomphosphaeria aponina SAG 52.96 = DSM 107014 TaxID=1521640 RepID=A0A941JUM5_9CHRO|nr:RNA methyltransferase [Gomphosphaeria aponina SAG 52.96 = DSM 107014]
MITSLQNPLLKEMRKLHLAKYRREQGLLLLEGTHIIVSALGVHYPLVNVFCTNKWQLRYPEVWEKLQVCSERAVIVSEEVMKAIATTVNPDGVVASALWKNTPPPPLININSILLLERLQDPGNLGTIIRTAAAANVDGLWLSGDSVDLYNPKVIRAAAGEWFRLPMGVSEDLKALITNYQDQKVQVVATRPVATKTYWEIDFTRPSLILLGNEGAGLSDELISIADEQVTIPLGAGVESLNVAIASALLLFEIKRQKKSF